MSNRLAHYDRDLDIAWLPAGRSGDVVSEEVSWGLIDRDRDSGSVVGVEIWSASTRIPAEVLELLPAPTARRRAA